MGAAKDWDVALLAYEQAAFRDPGQFGWYPPRGRALLELGDVQGAEVFARSALDANPGDPRLLQLLGEALAARGSFDEASEAFLEAGKTQPTARVHAVRAVARGGGPEAAERLVRRMELVGVAAVARGGGPEAAERLVRRMELVGEADPATRLEVARIRHQAGDLAGCARSIRRDGLTDEARVAEQAKRLLALCDPSR
jgi:tetratricopeptide (TPR) repeat protein